MDLPLEKRQDIASQLQSGELSLSSGDPSKQTKWTPEAEKRLYDVIQQLELSNIRR